MKRTFLTLSSALLLGALVSACGANNVSSVAQPSVAAPALSGTPVPVCERLLNRPFVAASSSVDGGISFEFASFDEALIEQLQFIGAANAEAFVAIEESFRGVKATRHDSDAGYFVRFEHDDEATLDHVHALLFRNVQRRPAAARRVAFRREAGYVDMQFPGGALIAARTAEAANETVQKWTEREPTQLELENTPHGIRVTFLAEDGERFDTIREDILAKIGECEPLRSSGGAPAAE